MTKIQWTDLTKNPINEVGGGHYCIPISPGCKNCYASRMNRTSYFGGNGRKFGVRPEGHPEMTLNIEMIQKWARMRKPKKIFVGSMTDIFGEWIPDWIIFALLDAMYQAPRQTFQILTKRPQRMAEMTQLWLNTRPLLSNKLPDNIWLGTSVEDQKRLDERLIWLIRTQASVRFLSLEPLLGPIALPDCDSNTSLIMQEDNLAQILEPIDYIDWIIIGGESGPNARPMDLLWVEDILRQCSGTNIPVFVKQLGEHWAKQVGAKHKKGGDPDEWPENLRVRMFPNVWKNNGP